MRLHKNRSFCEGSPGNMTCSSGIHSDKHDPCIEILEFIDPLCPECWGLEPAMKKFILEYHDYFKLRAVLTTKHDTANQYQFSQVKKMAESWDKCAHMTGMCCDSNVWLENPPSPYAIAIAIKAAEFQGSTAGNRFLRRIREQVFLEKKGLNRFEELQDVARLAKLNVEEFSNDFHSCRSIKALQADRRLANEMSITELPALLFTNLCTDDEAIKISGQYDYDVYVQILEDLLGYTPNPAPHPPLSEYFRLQLYLTTPEVAVVYDWSEEKALKELRKMQLLQIIEPVTIKSGEYWRYITNG
ncbi:DsbA family protein [Sporolactobacillus sp. THM19-2]|uniref:DsbA family protein n=1 Tax=Sporolactobacillus sp. THM19-2 TaxID=2511171 RepID=UPI001020B930|nr:DsbA family protein [Sporolactobacillus sp. THM19-2]RYL90266.1 DsbA family protein [Sporolactobacillus sp. THM19-2]